MIGREREACPSVRVAHLVRAKSVIEAHLRDPALSPESVAAEVGLSLRYLSALFAADDTSPARDILRRRLERYAASLADGT